MVYTPHVVSITSVLRRDEEVFYNTFAENIEHKKNIEVSSGSDKLIVCVDESPNFYDDKKVKRFLKIQEILVEKKVKAKFILDSVFLDESLISASEDVVFINLWRLLSQKLVSKQQNNKKVNFEKKLGLFLPGRIDRFNRLVLLKKLFERNILNKIIWSCHYSLEELNAFTNVRNTWFIDYTDKQWQAFIQVLPNVLDIQNFNKDYFFGCGFPFNHKLYEETIFSIVSESDVEHYARLDYGPATISEKTWKAMLNYHPFILVGNKGSVSKLEKWGYKTFREYMLDPNYNDIESPHKRINTTAKNIENFAKNLIDNKVMVDNDVKYNIQLCKKHCQNEKQMLFNFFSQYNTNLGFGVLDDILLGLIKANPLLKVKN